MMHFDGSLEGRNLSFSKLTFVLRVQTDFYFGVSLHPLLKKEVSITRLFSVMRHFKWMWQGESRSCQSEASIVTWQSPWQFNLL